MIGKAAGWTGFHVALLAISFAMMFFEGYDVQVLAYAAPIILAEWHVSTGAFGPVFGAGLLGYMIGATVLTGFADHFGRKPVVVCGTLWFGALTFATTFASDLNGLLALRLLTGFGLGVAIPTIMALNSEFAPPKVRSVWLTSLAVGYAIGGSLGGAAVAPAMAKWGWQAAFVVGGIAPIVVGIVLAAFLPESIEFLKARGASPQRIAGVADRYGLQAEKMSLDEVPTAPNARKRGVPVLKLFSRGTAGLTLLLWAAFVTSLLGHHFLASWVPTIMKQKGFDFQHAAWIGSLVLGGSVFGGPIIGLLADKYGGRVLAFAYLLSVPLVAAIGLNSMPPSLLPFVVFMAGATLVGGQIGITATTPTLYPTEIRSSGVGWALGIGRFGAILGPVVGGALLSANVPLQTIFFVASLPGLACALFILIIFSKSLRREPVQV